MAKYNTDTFLIVSIFASVPILMIQFLVKYESALQDTDALVEDHGTEQFAQTSYSK